MASGKVPTCTTAKTSKNSKNAVTWSWIRATCIFKEVLEQLCCYYPPMCTFQVLQLGSELGTEAGRLESWSIARVVGQKATDKRNMNRQAGGQAETQDGALPFYLSTPLYTCLLYMQRYIKKSSLPFYMLHHGSNPEMIVLYTFIYVISLSIFIHLAIWKFKVDQLYLRFLPLCFIFAATSANYQGSIIIKYSQVAYV